MGSMILTSTTVVDNIIAQVTPVITMMIDTMTTLLGNPFFCFLFATGFVSIALHLINVAKGVSR